MLVFRHVVTARGSLVAATLMLAPIALHAQVTAPGTNPRTPTTNPAPTTSTTPTTTTPTTSSTATDSQSVAAEIRNDLPFLREAAGANLLEVRLGQLAQSKASNSAVKQFGQRMATDHTKLQQELSSMVSMNGVALNAALTSEHYQKINRLQSLSGQPFDTAYMSMMIQDHQTDVTHFDTQSRNADSPQVRELAARSLPVLQRHLTLAQQVGGQVSVQVATTTPGSVTNPSVRTTPQQAQNQNSDLRADSKFIREVIADNLLEVRRAELAQRKAKSSSVKQFAERMAADYSKLQDDWTNMTSVSGQEFKPGMGKSHQAKVNQLEKLSGRAFDRAYMSAVIVDHRDYIAYFEKEGKASRSSQVREMVQRELPILRTHFNQAKRVGAEVGADVNVTLRSESDQK